jgi:ketosteroid isomerase-like protein
VAGVAGENERLIEELYAAFARRDGRAMAALYAPDAEFSDPVFTHLRGDEPGLMWRMLTEGAEDLEIELVERDVAGDRGTARWRARYTFTQTGRHVDNDVRSMFRFAGGKIGYQRDEFSFRTWARQALGPTGWLLGWSSLLRNKVRSGARARLDEFAARERAS